jgi:hypothetical protein
LAEVPALLFRLAIYPWGVPPAHASFAADRVGPVLREEESRSGPKKQANQIRLPRQLEIPLTERERGAAAGFWRQNPLIQIDRLFHL